MLRDGDVWDFLAVQWLRLPSFHCRGHRFNPSWRTEGPACRTAQPKEERHVDIDKKNFDRWERRDGTSQGREGE